MNTQKSEVTDFPKLYRNYENLSKGAKAELRRVATPDKLMDIPSFYRLIQSCGCSNNRGIRRVVFCLPYLTHENDGESLGKALANQVREKRLIAVTRTHEPNDIIQLRRILQQVKPTVDFSRTVWLLLGWNKLGQKQKLLENFFLHQK